MSLTNRKTRPSLLPSLLKLQPKLRVSSRWFRAICFMASRLWSTNTGLFPDFLLFSYAFLNNYGKSDFVVLRLFGICMNICQIWRQGCATTLWSHNDLRSDGGKKHLFGGTVQREKSTILGQEARFTWVSVNQFGQEASMVWMSRRHMGWVANEAKQAQRMR